MLFDVNGPVDADSLFVMDGIMHGFKLVDPGAEVGPYISDNYYSATVGSREEMDVLIQSELAQGKLSVVHVKPECVHAMGAIRKPSGKIRNITDCSRPENLSINSYMEETFSSFSYKSVDTVTSLLDQGDFMAVTDISNAYRSIMIRPCDRTRQGLSWFIDGENVWLEDNCISFGTRAAPFIFSRITDAIVRYLERNGIRSVNYLDDFIVLGSSESECTAAQLFLHQSLRNLGFYIAYPEVVSPSTKVTYLGVVIDWVNMQLSLPQEKLDKLQKELEFFSGRRRATKKQIQRLCGILGHCSTLVKGGRTFSHRVISLLKCFTQHRRYVTLNGAFRLDLLWWKEFSAQFNGEAKIISTKAQDRVVLQTDSSDQGYGAVWGSDWCAGTWMSDLCSTNDLHGHLVNSISDFADAHISVKEMYPILVALQRWGPKWRDKKIDCMTDNTQVLHAINKGRSVNDLSMSLLRRIFWLTVMYNCHVRDRSLITGRGGLQNGRGGHVRFYPYEKGGRKNF